MGPYEFIVRPDASQNHPVSCGCPQLTPFLLVGWIDVHCKVIRPIYPRALCIPYICDIIDMLLANGQHCCPSTTPLCDHPLTMKSISPQTTLCLNNPALFSPVKNPSLPARSSLQSLPSTAQISAAFCVCVAFIPNIIHLPIRSFVSESHRGEILGNSPSFDGLTTSLERDDEPIAVEAKDRETCWLRWCRKVGRRLPALLEVRIMKTLKAEQWALNMKHETNKQTNKQTDIYIDK
jgi:hypothetical protein